MRGKFITIEGVEGVGKSTNIAHLKHLLESNGIDYAITREPGGTPLAEKIRGLLLAVDDEPLSVLAELLLVFAARAQHLERFIKPQLDAGIWVLCDRFTDATFAYQGAGRGLDAKTIATLQELVQNGLRPDLTIILDLDPVVGMQRATERGALDRFELEQIEFFRRVRQCYLNIAAREPNRCAVIDASRSLAEVEKSLLSTVRQRLDLK